MAEKVIPLVSIIIPVYNGKNYLAEAIDSALAQTYGKIEVIVINDGSTDNSHEIAISYGDRIRYYQKENGGVSTALNLGLSVMHGEYFSWLSHDDLYHPNKIYNQIIALENNCNGIAYSDYDVIDKDGMHLVTMNIAKIYPKTDLTIGLFPILRQVLNGCTLLIHVSHFSRVGKFDESLRAVQDYDMWFRMLRGVKLTYVNAVLVSQRQHGAQVTHRYEAARIEANRFWLKMVQDISEDEACQVDGSELSFWDNQVEFLRYTNYRDARLYAKACLKSLGGGQVTLPRLLKRATYSILTMVARFVRLIRVQKLTNESRLINLGYRLWFGVRYK